MLARSAFRTWLLLRVMGWDLLHGSTAGGKRSVASLLDPNSNAFSELFQTEVGRGVTRGDFQALLCQMPIKVSFSSTEVFWRDSLVETETRALDAPVGFGWC